MQFNATAAAFFEHANKMMDAYAVTLQPLCDQAGMPLMALDILLFLANNPDYSTAREICRIRGFKPGIVSFHVERLVGEGLLRREAVPGDRRKARLVCTQAAAELIEQGRARQRSFAQRLMAGLSDAELTALRHCMDVIDKNIAEIRAAGKRLEGSGKDA